jgi:putative transposase
MVWQDEARTFATRDLSGTDYVYLWVDGIHLKVRLEQEKLCLLLMIGVRTDGRKELVPTSLPRCRNQHIRVHWQR